MYLYPVCIYAAIFLKYVLALAADRRTTITVGAIFYENEKEIELGFDQAFHEANSLKFSELHFVTIKRFLPTNDSLLLQQITCELISNGVAAIFGPSSKAASDIVAQIANMSGIPHIEYDLKIDPPLQEYVNHQLTVNVAPPLSALSKAYFEIIRSNYRWRSFTVIYDTPEGLARLQNLLNINELNRDYIKLRNLADYSEDYRVLWKESSESNSEQKIILDCDPKILKELLKISQDFKLQGPFRSWFLTHPDTHSSGLRHIYNRNFRANITSVRLKVVQSNPFDRKKTRITRVDQILGNQMMLPTLIYDAVILFTNSMRNVIANMQEFVPPNGHCGGGYDGPWIMGAHIVKEMKTISEDDVEPPYKTENMQLNEYGRRAKFNLEIYKPTVNEPLMVWTPDNGLRVPQTSFVVETKTTTTDFSEQRKVFTVATHYEDPYFMLKEDHENFRGREKYRGYAVDLIAKLSELLDFDYEFMIVNGNGKYDVETKQWDGIMRKLIDHVGQAQIGICDITITQTRREVVDFTVPFMQLGISILYYKSDPEPKNPFAFLEPFAEEVWIYMLFAQLVVTLAFVVIARLSHHEWMPPNPAIIDPDELENIWNVSNSWWLMVGSIMQQGCDILPRGPHMRILTGMWWFFALMMLSTYTANLAAFLTNNRLESSINSLQDLIEQDKVKFGSMMGGSTSLFFSESNETDYQRAWNQMKGFNPSALTKSNKEGVERVTKEKGDYAFLMETTSLAFSIEHNCKLRQIGGQIGEKHYGIAVPLGAEYRTNLSVSILQLSERGELYKLKNRWWKNPKKNCTVFHEVDGDELSIIELGGVFLALAGGVLTGVILGILEFLWNIQHVAAEQRITMLEAMKGEFIFALKFWVRRKPCKICSSSSSTADKSSRRSSASRHSSKEKARSKTIS